MFQAVSGLVPRIGNRYAIEMCETALRLHATFQKLESRQKMELVSGIHTGLVAAGVVGLKRPRYCM